MEYYKKEEDDLVPVPDHEHKLISEFYSYLSDDSDQKTRSRRIWPKSGNFPRRTHVDPKDT
eukprot:14679609-Ditylum_brightwellii.AAC.1